MNFSDLRLCEPILRSLHQERYQAPTPIQVQAIPNILSGRDLLGAAQTGTGKTAAFALPILQLLSQKKSAPAVALQNAANGHRPTSRAVRCLVLAPTRELALQIDESFRVYGRHLTLKHAVVFGGVSQHGQVQAIARGVDVLVATPGRLLDLVNQRLVNLSRVEILVLDEADRMLDMGFINDIRKIIALLPKHRQTLMFSATMPTEIRSLAASILKNPANVNVAPAGLTIDKIDQSVYFVERKNKPVLLAHLINNTAISRALVFTRTKHGADRVVRQLHQAGIRAEAIHGNKSQNARQRALNNFKSGKLHVLIASDVASRGIDVDDISHVFNYDVTHEPETYIHRIGRTARAGATGYAISFCDVDERENLRAIERLTRKPIRVNEDQPKYSSRERISHEHSQPKPPHRSSHNAQRHHAQASRTAKNKPAARPSVGATLAGLAGRSHAPMHKRPRGARRLQHPLHRGR